MSESKENYIRYFGLDREITADSDKYSLLEYSIRNKIPHLHECGGNGKCTTCRIRIIEGAENLSKPTAKEKIIREERSWDPTVRLACQTYLNSGHVVLERLIWTNAEISNLQLETISFGIGDERELAVLFCDMRDFTPMAGKHPTFDVAHMLNRYFTELGEPVFMNNGIIYQYAGDEIIAIFGTGGGDPDRNCLNALRAGLGMIEALGRLNERDLKEFDVEAGTRDMA